MCSEYINQYIDILSKYLEGYTIQLYLSDSDKWVDIKDPSWNFGKSKYRVKNDISLKKFIAYHNAKDFWNDLKNNKWIVEKDTNRYLQISSFDDKNVVLNNQSYSYEEIFLRFIWPNGKACGIEV